MPKDDGIGAATVRREDVRFLTGAGRYTDDIQASGEAVAMFARSNVANGVIKNIDISHASTMPGVLAIFTGDDFTEVGGNPAGWLINSRDGTPMHAGISIRTLLRSRHRSFVQWTSCVTPSAVNMR